jgi:hypothetical protein
LADGFWYADEHIRLQHDLAILNDLCKRNVGGITRGGYQPYDHKFSNKSFVLFYYEI